MFIFNLNIFQNEYQLTSKLTKKLMKNNINPFHLAIPVNDLKICREFYGKILNCEEGRSSSHWVDFNFFGHQLVIHQRSKKSEKSKNVFNPVDGHEVPIPHFGVVLDWEKWHLLKELLSDKDIQFIIEPYIRFKGEPGEQATMFFLDPEGNALEFKAFKKIENLFSK